MLSRKIKDRWRQRLKKVAFPVLSRWYNIYSKKERTYTYQGLKVTVPPTVFHPGIFISTKVFAGFLDELDIRDNTVLELGCGSGLLSLYAAKKGGEVTASDINPFAVNGLIYSSIQNGLNIAVFESDLFAEIPPNTFDFIFINPPYYPKTPANLEEHAFYCGENFDYFHRLFKDMPAYAKENSEIYMILSEDCDLDQIRSIGAENGFTFSEVWKRQKMWEWNYIFQLKSESQILSD